MPQKPSNPASPEAAEPPRTVAPTPPGPTLPPLRPSGPRIDHPTPAGLRHVVHARGTATSRVRARGTPREAILPGEQIRTMVFAPAAELAAWIESELSRAPISISIQLGRRVRTVVSALVRDPPPRPHVLIVDFDALSAGEVLELHAIRDEGWTGRLIGLGTVRPALSASLDVDRVLAAPLVRDSLLDIVAGTGHAAATVPIPVEMLDALAPGGRPRR
jgi:hypothetical protein